MKFQTHINAALICMGIVLAGIVQADVPHKINYQGVLKDDNGVKIDGTVDISLRLLPLGGGAEVFTESHTGVSVVGGLFSLKIGGVEDLSEVVFDAAYELELTVGGELMVPNVPLCSAPYALGVAGGAQGPQGKVGPAGADGTAGAAGAQGPQGKQGDAGPVGSEFWDASGDDIHNTNSGNVGIGTTNAAQKLTVQGNIRLLDEGGSRKLEIETVFGDGMKIEASRAVNTILQLSTGAGGGMYISGKGNTVGGNYFGIETSGPTERLDVDGGGRFRQLPADDSLDSVVVVDSTGVLHTRGAASLSGGGGGAWEDNGTNVWRTGGKVGIGTDSPGARLHVKDETTAIRIETEGSWGYTEYVDSGAIKYSMGYRAAGGEHFWLGTTDLMTGTKLLMKSDGDLLLGGSITGGAVGGGIVVRNNGHVEFGTPNSGFQDGSLHVGTALVTAVTVGGSVSATAFHTTSDERCKENIQTVSSALEKVTQLRGVNFNWREDVAAKFKDMDPDELQLGLIAQEVEEVVPEVVHTSSVGGYKSVSYQSLTGLLVEAIKEQRQEYQSQIDALRTEVEGLKAAN